MFNPNHEPENPGAIRASTESDPEGEHGQLAFALYVMLLLASMLGFAALRNMLSRGPRLPVQLNLSPTRWLELVGQHPLTASVLLLPLTIAALSLRTAFRTGRGRN
jgi:hypothetical protein